MYIISFLPIPNSNIFSLSLVFLHLQSVNVSIVASVLYCSFNDNRQAVDCRVYAYRHCFSNLFSFIAIYIHFIKSKSSYYELLLKGLMLSIFLVKFTEIV